MFDKDDLIQRGFVGFRPLQALPRGCPDVPCGPGIYAVVLESPTTGFLPISKGGHFKGNDPTVPPTVLEEKWLEGVATVYIGRATNLRSRLGLLARYGRGEPVAHQGGRFLWQLTAQDRLTVAWLLEEDPVGAEHELIDEFERGFGQLPFANLIRGTRPLALT